MHDPKPYELLRWLRRERQGTLTQEDSRLPVPLVGLVGDRGIARKSVLGQYPYGLEGRPGAGRLAPDSR